MSEQIVRVIDLLPGEVRPMTSISAEALTEDHFWNEHVCKSEPILIEGAGAGWSGLEKWKRKGYLADTGGDAIVRFGRTFNALPLGPFRRSVKEGKLSHCLREMAKLPADATYSIPSADLPEAWSGDLGEIPFLTSKYERPPSEYAQRRLFIYKNASTEWHYHPSDETLTFQLLGSKNVSLFCPDESSWDTYASLLGGNFHHIAGGHRFFPTDAKVVKLEGVIHPGDCVYIPPFWWHGIDPADSELGVTMAHCFLSPENGVKRRPARAVGQFVPKGGAVAVPA